MKMNSFGVLFVIFVSLANCSPNNPNNKSLKEETFSSINKIFAEVNNEKFRGLFAFTRSIDRECIFTNYKSRNMLDHLNYDKIANRRDSNSLALYAFVNVAAICSSKTDTILQFLFENLMTHQILYKAFIDDPEFSDEKSLLTCANNYAVENLLIDPNVYDINYTVDDEMLKRCSNITSIIKVYGAILHSKISQQFKKNSLDEIKMEMKNFALKYFILVQVDLTPEQKQQERDNLVKDARMVMENILKFIASELEDDEPDNDD